MRWTLLTLGLLAAGCGGVNSREAEAPAERLVDFEPEGSDWCQFLGPLGTSVSPEKGIIAPWPADGLRVVWQMPVGMGYGMPATSQGRLFLFDQHGDKARLSCFRSATKELL